jgi:hypothetical protein
MNARLGFQHDNFGVELFGPRTNGADEGSSPLQPLRSAPLLPS